MDKITSYSKIISSLLNELASHPYDNTTAIEKQVLSDIVNHHYQLLNVGWHRGRFVYSPMLHFDIRGTKIWIQQNATELEIGDVLVSKGVRPEDIVFGFIPEQERSLVKLAAV